MNFVKMQQLQRELQDTYIDSWGGLSPKKGKEKLLWMMIEAGEIADIMKKEGDDMILTDSQVRGHFMEEICDVLMYLNDVMLCYNIEPEALEQVYLEKHEKNLKRW